jgi:hypothetical protein
MSLSFVIASVFLVICFTLEYFFTKKRPFSDYFMIFFSRDYSHANTKSIWGVKSKDDSYFFIAGKNFI